jgi:alkylhydroperoxidase family enzyme
MSRIDYYRTAPEPMNKLAGVTKYLESSSLDPRLRALVVAEHFSEKEIVDLTIAISLINAWNRISIGFRKLPD